MKPNSVFKRIGVFAHLAITIFLAILFLTNYAQLNSLRGAITNKDAQIKGLAERSASNQKHCPDLRLLDNTTEQSHRKSTLISNSPIRNSNSYPLAQPKRTDHSNPPTTLDESVSPATIKNYMEQFFGDDLMSSFADHEIADSSVILLADYIQSDERTFPELIEAAEAINDISGMPLPEHLSQTILSRSIKSNDPDQQIEALVLISEQHYPDTTFYSEALLASPNEEVRKFAIHILANNYDKNRAAAIIADQLLSNPVSMANILIDQLADY